MIAENLDSAVQTNLTDSQQILILMF